MRDYLWRLLDIPPSWWFVAFVVVLYIAGITDPTCCPIGTVDDMTETVQ